MSYRIDPAQPLADEVRRIATEQLEGAIASLQTAGEDWHDDIHSARKNLKKLRALHRLIRFGAKDVYRRENVRLRDAARGLSGLRDATALIETVDKLAQSAAITDQKKALDQLRAYLDGRRTLLAHVDAGLPGRVNDAIDACRESLRALDSLTLPGGKKGGDLLARGYARIWEQAGTALAVCRDGGSGEDFHELRKQVKYHWLHVRLLRPAWPSAMRLRAREAKALSQMIGDEHDLTVLSQLLDTEPKAMPVKRSRAIVDRLIATRRTDLRHEAIAGAAQLFDESPETVGKRIKALWTISRKTANSGERAQG